MRRQQRALIANRLGQHLARFHPDQAESFACPTCLSRIPLSNLSEIGDAHILPKAAGGGYSTLICRRCNSIFGSKQDKWFGEYLRLRRKGKDLLETKITPGGFTIDGVRYGGTFSADRERGVEFTIYSDRTAPKALDQVLEHALEPVTDASHPLRAAQS